MDQWEKKFREHLARRSGQGPILIIIGGGSAAGKGRIAHALAAALVPLSTRIVNMDRYFKPVAELPTYYSPRINAPHSDWNQPNSFRHQELVADMRGYLRDGATSEDVLILEGILALHFGELRQLADLSLFIHTEADERIVRRLRRNITARGMTFDEVADYYLESVRDRHLQFVEPTRLFADLVIPGGSRVEEEAQRKQLITRLADFLKAELSKKG